MRGYSTAKPLLDPMTKNIAAKPRAIADQGRGGRAGDASVPVEGADAERTPLL